MGDRCLLDDLADECSAREQLLDSGVVMHSFVLTTAAAVMPEQTRRPAIEIESGPSKDESVGPLPLNKARPVQRFPATPPPSPNDGKKPDLKKPLSKQPDLKRPKLPIID